MFFTYFSVHYFSDLTDKSAKTGQHYYPYYGNMLIGESFFDTEGKVCDKDMQYFE